MRKMTHTIVVLAFSAVLLFAQNETLRGDEAIEKLKQTGQYDSLLDAVKAARQKDGQTEEPPVEGAVGQSARLSASDGEANDQFGFSVALNGETAIVGAFLDNVGANSDQGSAYVFVRSGTVWTEQQKLTASDGAASDQFGFSVSISGDTRSLAQFLMISAQTLIKARLTLLLEMAQPGRSNRN
jgi:hypothetical protein